jgi:hypothetical protein
MRRAAVAALGLAAAGLAFAGSVRAQNAPVQSTELPPLQEQTQPYGTQPYGTQPGVPGPVPRAPGPPLPAFPNLPGPNAQGQAPSAAPQAAPPAVPGGPPPGTASGTPLGPSNGTPPGAVPATPPVTVERPNAWVPAAVAKLQALDKVNAQTSELMIKVGQSATFGSLTITVKSCMVRPPDQPADAAAYLDVTDSHPDSPGFDGWILEEEPSASMMQHPIYDLRVTGCA